VNLSGAARTGTVVIGTKIVTIDQAAPTGTPPPAPTGVKIVQWRGSDLVSCTIARWSGHRAQPAPAILSRGQSCKKQDLTPQSADVDAAPGPVSPICHSM
jgi:hypothetical protein